MIGKRIKRYFLIIGDRQIEGAVPSLKAIANRRKDGSIVILKKDGSLDIIWMYGQG